MLRVLFVDDEPAILGAFRRLLHSLRSQWQIEFVSSAQAALEKMDHAEFDVVVSDMRMPGMDGAQLLAEVMRRRPSTIRILLSGMITEEAMTRAAANTHHLIAKPCDVKQLVALIEDAVRSARQTAVASTGSPAPEMDAQLSEQAAGQHSLLAAKEVRLLVDGAAHDLRNILTVINGFADVIRDGSDPASPLQAAATEIMLASDRGAVVAGQLAALGNHAPPSPAAQPER
jgi:DNA-binding NtrC family response regulator